MLTRRGTKEPCSPSKNRHKGQEFVIGGYVPDNPFDSIIVGYYQDGTLMYAAKVRNGFVPRTRWKVFQRIRGLEIDTCPFANLLERNAPDGR